MDQQNPSSGRNRNFYILAGKLAGWASVLAFTVAFIYKLGVPEYLFTPADLFQAALYLVLFAIFASMAAVGSN